jgi:predicted permease
LSLLLLMGATLFVRSLHNMAVQKLGYDRDRILMVRIDPVSAGYKGASLGALYQELREKLRLIPGVFNVTLSNTGLFSGDSGDQISIDSAWTGKREDMHSSWTLIGPDYFRTVGIALLRGREIDTSDAARAMQVAVVNEAFAKFFFPDSDPIGKHVTDEYPTTRETYQIVGVVPDAREHTLRQEKAPRFYANIFHPIGTVESVTLLLSSSGDPATVAPSVRRAIADINPGLPVLSVHTLNEQIDRRLITQRLIAELSAFFGGLALLTAAIGLYGVMSYAISRRTSEIGIRMALGASKTGVIWMVLGETIWLVAIGVAIGLPCALASGRWITSRLFGLTTADPISIAIAITIILGATLAAGYVPARRAAHTDPMQALRYD